MSENGGSRLVRRFDINEKFEQGVLKVYEAATRGYGIFAGGYDVWKFKFLPQWMGPKELEFSPRITEVKSPLELSEYLWTSLAFERQNISRFLHKKLKEVWYDPTTRWFFKADEIVKRPLPEIEEITKNRIFYNLDDPPQRVIFNAIKLANEYAGDPRKLLDGYTVEEARNRLMEFWGIGTGNANLHILHMMDRGIATPLDPDNALFKVDVHKGRIPLNVGGVDLLNGYRDVHVGALVERFEEEYWRICRKNKLNPIIADAALWVLGSEVCSKRSYRVCLTKCSLASTEICLSNIPLNQEKGGGAGRYILFDEFGNRAETRRDKQRGNDQIHFLDLYQSDFN